MVLYSQFPWKTYIVKNIHRFTDILWQVSEPVPYTFVSVNRRSVENSPQNISESTDSLFYRTERGSVGALHPKK